MKISIVIVNYNVAKYLEQCLKSVVKAIDGIESEIFVVDNNSVDGSCQMLQNLFPNINLIENVTNVGFAKANNQAIKQAGGEYILLLNPDTVVEKESFKRTINYMDSNPETGGLGVKMIDGNGNYLPESKRGFPYPIVAFYKLSGLSRLFPKSKYINKYHLGYLDNDSIHEVDVLSGAFMLIRKSVLDKIGLLDETYFMYGEDIDLSYRIINAGYKNIYFPKTTIIHYKGQSTQKGSLNYVILFYKAMKIFAKKNFSKSHARSFLFFINIAIYLRGFISLIHRTIAKLIYPISDFIVLYVSFAIFSPYWSKYRYNRPDYDFPAFYYHINIPIYATILVIYIYISGTYIRPIDIKKTIKSIAIGMLINLVLFALLPDELRFSRAMFLVGTVGTFTIIPLCRIALHFIDKQDFEIKSKQKRRTIIVGNEDECLRVNKIIKELDKKEIIIGYVSNISNNDSFFIGNLNQLKSIIKIHKINTVIFCEQDIPETIIINKMIQIAIKNIDYKIAPHHSHFIIGNEISNSISDIYTIDINSIALPRNKTLKRIFDISLSCILLICSPLLVFYFGRKIGKLIKNCLIVLELKKTWIGYNNIETDNDLELPKINEGIIFVASEIDLEPQQILKMNIIYAKDYSIFKDINIIFYNFSRLDS